ncbi:uncharacterized protein LOC142180767 [Nicotiana tabacum]|uniref:Uncharacterized protein LOC142180767 n=1 Tax=Nicotiana tabacum TaxID=4097 RepID=A0AC58UHG8_TOBAC
MAAKAINFFQNKFLENVIPIAFGIIDHVPNMVTFYQNQELVKQPTKDEVKKVVFGLNGDSAGGPDVFTGKYFQSCWDVIEDDVFNMVRQYFNGHELPRFITHTNPVILPKEKEVATFSDMRSISLNNFVNKVFSRVIHERLSRLLPNLISYEQLYGFFKSARGVKQGDPLSPTLFILATEAMSRGLNALHLNLYFYGFGMPKWSPKVNHLVYADDTIIFSSSNATLLQLIMEVLVHMRKMDYNQGLVNKVLDKLQSWKVGGRAKHWASWDTLCLPQEGGIGFRSLHDVSKALFCKLWTGLGSLYFVTPPDFYSDGSIHNIYDVIVDVSWDEGRLLIFFLKS